MSPLGIDQKCLMYLTVMPAVYKPTPPLPWPLRGARLPLPLREGGYPLYVKYCA